MKVTLDNIDANVAGLIRSVVFAGKDHSSTRMASSTQCTDWMAAPKRRENGAEVGSTSTFNHRSSQTTPTWHNIILDLVGLGRRRLVGVCELRLLPRLHPVGGRSLSKTTFVFTFIPILTARQL